MLSTLNPDAPEAQVIFLNFRPHAYITNINDFGRRGLTQVLGMLGLSNGFISSCSLGEMRSIILLASYGLDWRDNPELYTDMLICFSRANASTKTARSNLPQVTAKAIRHIKHIQKMKIEANLDYLQQQNRLPNNGPSAVIGPGVSLSGQSIQLVAPLAGPMPEAQNTAAAEIVVQTHTNAIATAHKTSTIGFEATETSKCRLPPPEELIASLKTPKARWWNACSQQ